MITVRQATENDLPQILAIYNGSLKTPMAVYYEPHTLDMRRQWFEERKQLGLPVFVGRGSGRSYSVWYDRALPGAHGV